MQMDSDTQLWTVPTFSKLLDYQTDSNPNHKVAVAAAENSLTGANPTDFSILRGEDISSGLLVATLLLSRAAEQAKVDIYATKAITVLRSKVDENDLQRACGVLAPDNMDVRTSWHRYGDYGNGINWRDLHETAWRKLTGGEITRLIASPEPMILSCDLKGTQEAQLPDYPRNTLTLGPIDAEIVRLLIGFEYPDADPQAVETLLAALDFDGAMGQITPFDLVCASRARDAEGAFTYLSHCLARPFEAKPSAEQRKVAKAVAPLEDLVGYGEAKRLALDIVSALKDWQAGKIAWNDVPRGLLLVGKPGTGKTELARSMAGSADVNFVSGSYADWQKHGHLGDFINAMSTCFDAARNQVPCILFIDELDSFSIHGQGKQRGQNASYDLKATKSLLEQLDGINGREGVAIVAAANLLEEIPPVVRRSGRFDSVVEIGLPSREDLEVIFQQHLQDEETAVDVTTCAVHALGRTGADCAAALRKARAVARRSRQRMSTDDVVHELSNGLRDLPRSLSYRMAIHECGHALVAAAYPELQVDFLRLSAGGGECQTSGAERFHTKATMHRDRTIMLGGRVAEELVLGEVSSGAGGNTESDLAKVTVMAANEVGAYGFGDGGAIWLGPCHTEQLLHETLQSNFPEIAGLVAAAEAEARKCLADKVDALRAMAEDLIKSGVLAGQKLSRHLTLVQSEAG